MLRIMGALGLCCLLFAGCADAQKRAAMADENEKVQDLDVHLVATRHQRGDSRHLAPFDQDGEAVVQAAESAGIEPGAHGASKVERLTTRDTSDSV